MKSLSIRNQLSHDTSTTKDLHKATSSLHNPEETKNLWIEDMFFFFFTIKLLVGFRDTKQKQINKPINRKLKHQNTEDNKFRLFFEIFFLVTAKK